ncbi:hypothetical protein [Paraburkholderia sp. MM5482-R1]|uniref:hypothetical protein n=1 Tax=unclassified Paraburkholderia TaxID=2615204 RepID=UPI003D1BB105
MDPITTAVIAAVSAGASSEITKKAIAESYDGLKALLKKKFGSDSDVADAVDKLEKKPDAAGRRQTVEDELVEVNAGDDPDLLAAAQALLDQIKATSGYKHNVQFAHGTGIAQASDGGSASVTFHDSRPPTKND